MIVKILIILVILFYGLWILFKGYTLPLHNGNIYHPKYNVFFSY